ncbi:cyclic nucleotide-binding domain-containing protein [Acidobacteriota bacterium]
MAEKDKKSTRMSESPLFEGIPQEKQAEIARIAQDKVLPAHTVLFRQGDPGDSYYIIKAGRVRIFRKSEDGMETDLSELGPGESFGEMALLTGKPRSAWAETAEETQLTVFRKAEFDRILKDHPDISLAFIQQMSNWILRDDIRLEKETRQELRPPGVSWIDFVGIFLVAVLCAVLFNQTNPNGISLIPVVWSDDEFAVVSQPEAAKKQSGGEALFVDARPAAFFDEEHIEGSVNVPLAIFDIMVMMTLDEIEKEKNIVVYGRTISVLYDEQVAGKLALRGYKNVEILEGGLSAWKKNGYPTEP